MSKPKTEV